MNEDSAILERGSSDSPWKALFDRLSHRVERWQTPESFVLILLAIVVGIGAGYGEVAFRWLYRSIEHLSFVDARSVLGFTGSYYVIIIPALGGLIGGPLVYFFSREAKGHGVPEVMEAIALKGGRIRPIVTVIKGLASAVCIGTGGSVGPEGPIVQIGAGLGSMIGQVFRVSEDRLRILAACGAAGGIAATFNAPIAGALFALEVVIGDFSAANFVSVVLSAVAASAVGRTILGNTPAFTIPTYRMVSVWELFFYAILGVLASVVGTVFVRVLYKTEDIFDSWRFPEYLKPVPGGLLVGIIGFAFPQVLGVGDAAIGDALTGNMGMNLLLALVVLKILATSFSIGSGASGGVFAPAMFIGAMLGGYYGTCVHTLFPFITASSGAYAVVGMAALFASTARAPLTAIIIVFEMTNDYRIILPLMLATVLSTIIAELICKESIYTMKLARRGIHLARHRDIDVMQGVLVEEAMSTDVTPIPTSMTLPDLAREFEESHHHGLPVVDAQGELYGIVTIGDLEQALERPGRAALMVGDIATTNPLVAYPHEPMWLALRRLATSGLGRLPVVDPENPRRLVGMIRRRDVIEAYNTAILHRLEDQHRRERLKLGRLFGTRYVEMTVSPGSSAEGKALRDLELPETCLIVAIQRGRGTIVAHGDTVLQPGDRLTAITSDEDDPSLRRCVTEAL